MIIWICCFRWRMNNILKMKVFYVMLYFLFAFSMTVKAQDSVKVALVQAHLPIYRLSLSVRICARDVI